MSAVLQSWKNALGHLNHPYKLLSKELIEFILRPLVHPGAPPERDDKSSYFLKSWQIKFFFEKPTNKVLACGEFQIQKTSVRTTSSSNKLVAPVFASCLSGLVWEGSLCGAGAIELYLWLQHARQKTAPLPSQQKPLHYLSYLVEL